MGKGQEEKGISAWTLSDQNHSLGKLHNAMQTSSQRSATSPSYIDGIALHYVTIIFFLATRLRWRLLRLSTTRHRGRTGATPRRLTGRTMGPRGSKLEYGGMGTRGWCFLFDSSMSNSYLDYMIEA